MLRTRATETLVEDMGLRLLEVGIGCDLVPYERPDEHLCYAVTTSTAGTSVLAGGCHCRRRRCSASSLSRSAGATAWAGCSPPGRPTSTRAAEFTPADIPTLTSVTLDLLASVIARCLEAEEALSPETRRSALRARINAFVEQHLADPAMTPRTIADAHHISLRHLRQLLAEDETSPAAWIRHRRLELCRLGLANPRLHTRPVQAIATSYGFPDPAHFSRLFRATYGMSPRDFRNLRAEACANRQLPCVN